MKRLVALALLAASAALPHPATAYWTSSAPIVALSLGCTAARTSGDAVAGGDGLVRGFLRPEGGTCTATRPTYVERLRDGRWASQLSPYYGEVLSVADDGGSTYVLYRASDGLRLGVRSHTGTYATSQRLSATQPRSGDVTAAYGRWWAVWSEDVAGGAALFQAHTMRATVGREQITPGTFVDDKPSVVRLTDGNVVLAWQRHDPVAGTTNVYRGRTTDGVWTLVRMTDDGASGEPSIAGYGTKRLLAWTQAGRVVYADDITGTWQRRTLTLAGGHAPRVVGSGPRVFVTWTTAAGNAALAERSGDAWAERSMTPGAGGAALAVTAFQANATVLVAQSTRVVARTQARPSIAAFRDLGAWIDLYDTSLPVAQAVATMRANGVRTLYIETARYNSPSAVMPATARWLDAAKANGLRVVGWYLPGYSEYLDRDVARTVAAARYRTPAGHRFDAIGVDIEYMGASASTAAFNADVVTQLRRVRDQLGPGYPIAAITPPPTGMALNPNGWAGFPWAGIGQYSDVVMPMAYWSYRRDCPSNPHHCAYLYTKENAALSSRWTGLPVHVVGGVGDLVTTAQVADFVRGTKESDAIGGSIYDYATTAPAYWPYLRTLSP
ncbi:MAG TPA: hypothetical protein VFQ85_09230 [Mycobacteriales bacterium]|jgi:hypothetical protein|nr:hypothetical protein [Mycobacteriales bacterium]